MNHEVHGSAAVNVSGATTSMLVERTLKLINEGKCSPPEFAAMFLKASPERRMQIAEKVERRKQELLAEWREAGQVAQSA